MAVKKDIYETLMNTAPDAGVELFHGYTYSGHPLATAAAEATLDLYEKEALFARSKELAPYFEQAVHSLREMPNVVDIRNIGLVAGIELESKPGKPTQRAFNAYLRCFERGLLIRTTGDTIALSPPLIISRAQIDELIDILGQALRETGRD